MPEPDFENAWPSLHKWAKKLQNRQFDYWELISAVWLSGRLNRIKNPKYTSRVVKWAMLDYIKVKDKTATKRSWKKKGRKYPKIILFSELNGQSKLRFAKIIKSKNYKTAQRAIIQKDLFDQLIKDFQPREKLILKMRYLGGFTMKEIGRVHGCTESNISLIHKKLLARIEKRIAKQK